MTHDFISLAIIALVAAICPLIAQAIPRKLIPETVFLIVAGAVLGPHVLDVVWVSEPVSLLSDLGLAFLFLLAGYEIDPTSITGRQGRFGLATWAVSLALGFLAVRFAPGVTAGGLDGIAVAIALGTTALGTLLPILGERGLLGTPVGSSIVSYGTWGELGPVLAMAILLSTRASWQTIIILAVFALIAVVFAVVPARARDAGHRVWRFLEEKADTNSQTMMRLTVLLLIVLVAFSSAFDLDIVLGAFAAGFVLRFITPKGSKSLETKLEGIAYGFLIPIFFVVSGAKIDLAAVGAQPLTLVAFIAALLLIRAVPIYLALKIDRDTRAMSPHNKLTVALYCTTALPIIVAVTSVAVEAGAMDDGTASVLVAAGAVTVFLMPLLTSITYRVADVQPIAIVREAKAGDARLADAVRDHVAANRLVRAAEHDAGSTLGNGRLELEDLAEIAERVKRKAARASEKGSERFIELAHRELARRRADLERFERHLDEMGGASGDSGNKGGAREASGEAEDGGREAQGRERDDRA